MATTVIVARVLPVRPEQALDAWLDPAQAGRWLFRTADGTLERCEIDARIGGSFRIDERRGDRVAEHFGEYLEIEPPRRLVFDFWTSFSAERTRVTVTIAPAGDCSRITLRHDGVWADYAERTRHGWTAVLDRLDRVLNENALP